MRDNQLGELPVYLRVPPYAVALATGFSRDVRGIGHFGAGDLELTIQSTGNIEKAKSLFDAEYQQG